MAEPDLGRSDSMTTPQQPPSTDEATDGAPDRADADGAVVLSTDEDEQRDDLTVQPGNS